MLILVVIASGLWFYKNSQPVSDTEKFDYFIITKGSSASQVGRNLESKGFIKNALTYKIYLQFTGQTGKIQTGEFRLTPSYSLFQTVDALSRGPIELWVTIPEGLRREEVAQKFAAVLDKDGLFVADFLKVSSGKEGYLFPDTYLFSREASASSVVTRMTETFTSKTKNLENNSGMSINQAVVLASLLERETKTDAERPIVAGILMNRLDSDWPLQIDAAVQYAVASENCKFKTENCTWWPILTLEDLSVKSAYNTYKNQGLPPNPIANPGLSSLKAAFNPKENDYWYYIHDNQGQIHYARTLVEHNSNIAKYLNTD